MTIIKNEMIRPFDVDKTLVFFPKDAEVKGLKCSTAYPIDPVTKRPVKVLVNDAMVRLLIEEQQRGGFVIVWSRAGREWATNVIRALNLESYTNIIMAKPITYFDDTPVKKWMVDRVYIGPQDNYRR